MTYGLQIDVEEVEPKVIVRVDGRLDAPSSPALEKRVNQLIEEGHFQIVIDFSHVEYLSSAGMRFLLSTTKKLKAKDGSLALFSINDDVMEIIKMAGFERILNICNSEKEALQFS